MPCGTGKTFTSLKISEEFIKNRKKPTKILYLVPSIALVSQTISEWIKNYAVDFAKIDTFAICSDTTATRHAQELNKDKESADEQLSSIPISATTDPKRLIEQLNLNKTTVLFSTYHSIGVIKSIQDELDFTFDLIICDEAHRTVGFEHGEASEFRKVHDDKFLRAKKRLYMTATPKQYLDIEKVKKEASARFQEGSYRVFSMNDESVYGPIFYEMSFSDAISSSLLTDYKLVVLKYRRSQYAGVANKSNQTLTNGARILGSLSALSKFTGDDSDTMFDSDREPMKRAIAFFNRIEDAEEAEKAYKNLYKEYSDNDNFTQLLEPEVKSISSRDNTRSKNEKIAWLKNSVEDGTCKILTNPKSLTEGVDIPNLDAIIFMQKKSSHVDIVQAVGRIMRKAEGKKFGYIIIPVDVEEDLSQSDEFKTVYQVIQALRSHDERINQQIAQAQITNKIPSFICVMNDPNFNLRKVDWKNRMSSLHEGNSHDEDYLEMKNIWETQEAWNYQMNAVLIKKLGDRVYWDNWSKNIGKITKDVADKIKNKLESNNPKLINEYKKFKEGLKDLINPNFDSDEECYSILAQHVVTLPVLKSLFNANEDFLSKNSFINLLNKMTEKLGHLDKELKELNKFYESVERNISDVKDDDFGRQNLIKKIYDNFFQYATPKDADKYGIVYTPIEVIDFMIDSVSYLLKTKLNMELKDKRVKILEPFAGTGTFVSRILSKLKQDGATQKEIEENYLNSIIFHEILLTAYYTSLVNIEYSYSKLNGKYQSFQNGLWIDTFHLAESWYTKEQYPNRNIDFDEISEKAKQINDSEISVIIGNPPYRANQKSANKNNANLKYKNLDEKLKKCYLNSDKYKGNVVSVYNSYVRAVRFATDRIKNKGIMAFILDGGFIDNSAFAGFRFSLLKEFNSVYVYDLLGNVRNHFDRETQGENIFGNGSQSRIAVLFCVKDGTNKFDGYVNYKTIGEGLTTKQKLIKLKENISIENITWNKNKPDLNCDWINKRNNEFQKLLKIGTKEKGYTRLSIFQNLYSRGLNTGNEAWTINYDRKSLIENMGRYIEVYNYERNRYHSINNKRRDIQSFVNKDISKIQWHTILFNRCEKNIEIQYNKTLVLEIMYRPYVKKYISYNELLIREISKWKNLLNLNSNKNSINKFIICSGKGHTNPCYFSSNVLLNLDILPKSQCFPFYWFEDNKIKNNENQEKLFDDETSTKIEAINPDVISKFQIVYKDNKITSNDIFNYIYGVLNSPTYVNKYKNDLMKSLPAIPFLDNFWKYSETGEQLIDLHINYETQKPYQDVIISKTKEDYTVKKIKFGNNKDKSTIIYNDYIKIENIPLEAYEYKVNGKAPLEWVVSEYKYEVDKDTKIIHDPNQFDQVKKGKYIFDLILSLITVSLKTRDLINGLPEYKELDVKI